MRGSVFTRVLAEYEIILILAIVVDFAEVANDGCADENDEQ